MTGDGSPSTVTRVGAPTGRADDGTPPGRGPEPRRRLPPSLVVPLTLWLLTWLLAWAIGRGRGFGLI